MVSMIDNQDRREREKREGLIDPPHASSRSLPHLSREKSQILTLSHAFSRWAFSSRVARKNSGAIKFSRFLTLIFCPTDILGSQRSMILTLTNGHSGSARSEAFLFATENQNHSAIEIAGARSVTISITTATRGAHQARRS